MIKITPGPSIEKYAVLYNVPVGEVVEWMESYINCPENHERLKEEGMYEATEKERAKSIKAYVASQIS